MRFIVQPVAQKPRRRAAWSHAALWIAALLAALAGGAGAQSTPPPGGDTPLPAPAGERRITHQIAPGIRHVQVLREDRDRPLTANLLRADLQQPGWHLQVWPAQDVLLTPDSTRGRESVGKLAARHGALAAINGDFFPFTGDPLGLQITDGEIYSEPYPRRSAFGLTRDGRTLWGPVRLAASVRIGDRTLPIQGINRARKGEDLVVYTPRYGAGTGTNAYGGEVVVEWLNGSLRPGVPLEGTVSAVYPGQGGTAIPAEGLVLSGHGTAAQCLREAQIGDAVRLEIHLIGEAGQSWDDVWQAVGGGPRLLKNGQVCVGPGVEGFRSDVLRGRAPRSAVALTRTGELLLAAVDGRQMISAGMTLAELAEWLRAEGAVEAINLDGGGSTTFSLRQVVTNSPSDKSQRLIANALLLMQDTPPAAEEGELAILPPEETPQAADAVPVATGARVRFRAAQRAADGTWQELPEDAVTWALQGQIGLMAQDGTFLGMRLGRGALLCSTGKRVARINVVTTAGAPAAITTALEKLPDGSANVRTRVVDAYGNPVPDTALCLAYATAEGEQSDTAVTDAKGEARQPLPLARLAPETPVTVSAGAAPPAAVKLPKIAGAVAQPLVSDE